MPWSSNATFLVTLRAGDDEVQAIYKPGPGRAPAVGLPARALPARGGGVAPVRGARPRHRAAHDHPRRARSARARSSSSSRPTSSSTTSRCSRAAPTSTTSCARSAPSTSSPTTPIARAATACSASTGGCGPSTTGCASRRRFKLRTVIWEFADEPIPDDVIERFATACDRVPAAVADHLDEDEIDALLGRIRSVLARPVFPDRHHRPPVPLAPGRDADRDELDRLVGRNDPDELVRFVDRLTDGGDWDGLVATAAAPAGRRRPPGASCGRWRRWPSTAWPCGHPASGRPRVLTDDAGWFALGPLSEVAASTHPWAELAPWLEPGPDRRLRRPGAGRCAARTCATPTPTPPTCSSCRSCSSRGRARTRWPTTATTGPRSIRRRRPLAAGRRALPGADAAADRRRRRRRGPGRAGRPLGPPLRRPGRGRAASRATTAPPSPPSACPGPGWPRSTSGQALAWMAWGAASGGAHGRRRGGAAGRFGAWWAATALAGLEWPPEPGALGAVAGELRWFWWDPYEPPHRLAAPPRRVGPGRRHRLGPVRRRPVELTATART